MKRLVALTVHCLLGLALAWLAIATITKPAAPPLLIDAAARQAGQVVTPAQDPQLLFAPCPLGRRNLPVVDGRKA